MGNTLTRDGYHDIAVRATLKYCSAVIQNGRPWGFATDNFLDRATNSWMKKEYGQREISGRFLPIFSGFFVFYACFRTPAERYRVKDQRS
mmetsp:Transcript_5470/g.11121  ORF Transcript_5470/g.11121 Transcript_5470/m.11121 type:complete len:90 (+) Transcript_5470:101-370(+)